MAVSGLQHRAGGLVEIIPPGARGRATPPLPRPRALTAPIPTRTLLVATTRRDLAHSAFSMCAT